MVSYAIIYRQGLECYVTRACEAGLAGAIVPDLPVEESSALAEVCRRHDFSLVQLITPTTPRDRALLDRRAGQRLHLLCLRRRHHRRAERTAAGASGQRRLAAWADTAADLHRLRHQPPGARADAGPGGRRADRRLGDCPPRGRGGNSSARSEVLREIGDYVGELIAALQP